MNLGGVVGNTAKRISKALHMPTPYRLGNTVLNGLGYQAMRMIAKSAVYGLKPCADRSSNQEYKRTLDSDGIVVIKDFLPQAVFDGLAAEFEAARQAGDGKGVRASSDGGSDNWAIVFSGDDPRFPVSNAAMRNSPLIADLVGYITKSSVDYFPDSIAFLEQKLSDGAKETIDGTSFLHADVHYPTSKVVLYVTDVNEGDAPFVFCNGSHRISRGRLAVENELTMRLAKLGPGETSNPALRIFSSTPEITADQMARMGLVPTPVYAPRNTLIVANHCGFHSRGQFAEGRKRVTLRMSFRYLDAPRYRFRKVLDPLYAALGHRK